MATHSSVIAWRIPGTGEPGGLPSMGSHRIGHDWSDLAAANRWNSCPFQKTRVLETLGDLFHISQPGLPHSCLKCFICSPYMLRQSASWPQLSLAPPSHWPHPLTGPSPHWLHPSLASALSLAPPPYWPHLLTGATLLLALPSLWSLTSFQALSQLWRVFISGAFLHLPVTAMESPPTHRLLGWTAGTCKAGVQLQLRLC